MKLYTMWGLGDFLKPSEVLNFCKLLLVLTTIPQPSVLYIGRQVVGLSIISRKLPSQSKLGPSKNALIFLMRF